jgi:GT2 family glycosyltransferase
MSRVADHGPTDRARSSAAGAEIGTAGRPDGRPDPGRPDLSVIVVTHNRTELALTTLSSARAATGALDVEWIVVDSGSSENTADAVAAAYPDVVLLRERNIGFAAANNRALNLVRGRYVLLLNPDVEVVDGTFERLLDRLDAEPGIGMASVRQTSADGSLQYSMRRYPSPWLTLGEAIAAPRSGPLARWREEESRTELYETEVSADWLVGAFLIARAEALAEVGTLDERFFLYSEETDWCYRFHQAGWRVVHLPVMTVVHRSANAADTAKQAFGHAEGERPDVYAQLSYAKIQFAEKHWGRLRALVMRAGLILRHAPRFAVSAALSSLQPRWTKRARAERQALGVVLGLTEPPFARPDSRYES